MLSRLQGQNTAVLKVICTWGGSIQALTEINANNGNLRRTLIMSLLNISLFFLRLESFSIQLKEVLQLNKGKLNISKLRKNHWILHFLQKLFEVYWLKISLNRRLG